MSPAKPLRFLVFIALISFPVAGLLSAQDQASPPATDQPATPETDAFFLHSGDSPVVFLGDSITEQRMYTTLIETYVLTRYPDWKITFRNAGWGGDTASLTKRGDFETGLNRDVLALKPKVVFIDFGMNDARGGDDALTKYTAASTHLVLDVVNTGARVVLITPSPEEKYEPGQPAGSGYNLTLKKYSDGLKMVSDNERVPFIDQYTPFVAVIEAGRKAGILSTVEASDRTRTVRLTNDSIHPNWGGHLVMAAAILQAMHAPDMVSSVTVDAAAHSITGSEGCSVEWQNAQGGAVQFKRTDRVLPWPIPDDPTIDTVLKIPGFDPATALNRYMLQVTGLTAPSYKLSINSQPVGIYSSADLAKGVNLGLVRKGPVYDQAQHLLKAVITKNNDYYTRWRNVQLAELSDWLKKYPATAQTQTSELARLDKQIADDENSIDQLRQPVANVFRLEPVTAPAPPPAPAP